MIVFCLKCKKFYDDARCNTLCPHEQFLPDHLIEQKDLAASLIGKDIRFNHMTDDGHCYRVQSIGWDGMVTICGGDELPGEFAPHLFTVVK